MSKFRATALDPVFDSFITFEVVSYQKVKIFPAHSTAPFSFRYLLLFHVTCRCEFPFVPDNYENGFFPIVVTGDLNKIWHFSN